MSNKRMGGSSVDANVLGVRFADTTYQTTAGVGATGGSAFAADATGVTITDPFGGVISTSALGSQFGAANSGGGFSQFYNGTVWTTAMGDGNGNGLFLGTGIDGTNFNLSNVAGQGIVNPTGSVINIIGNPINLVGPTSVNGVLFSGTAPTAGQVLTASDGTNAAWVTPAGASVTKTARIDMGTIASATPSLVTAFTWPTPFADNNYTITGSVVILETPPAGAATAIVCVGSIELQASGVGFNFVVCNADGLPHHVIANFIAVHD